MCQFSFLSLVIAKNNLKPFHNSEVIFYIDITKKFLLLF